MPTSVKPCESNAASSALPYVTHRLQSPLLGEITYSPDDAVAFPGGLPGFPGDDAFLVIERIDWRPLLLLQSVLDQNVCLPVVPVLQLMPQYRVHLDSDQRSVLQLDPDQEFPDPDILVLATVRFDEGGDPTVNLMAPLVVRVSRRRGAQIVQTGEEYPLQARLLDVVATERPHVATEPPHQDGQGTPCS